MKYSKIMILPFVAVLSACAKPAVVTYNPQDFINPNRVVTQKVPVHVVQPKVAATFGYGNDPEVVKAYKHFTKTGVARTINSKSFKTFAYDAYSHPLVECAPAYLCVIQLERGEAINNIQLGDEIDWKVGRSLIGSPGNGSWQVVIKPTRYNVATDMVITTDKRTYDIGLISKKGAATHIVNFYYPEETLNQGVKVAYEAEHSPMKAQLVSSSSKIDLGKVNFNYHLKGDYPAWRPSRVFDDGIKTYIQMPPISERLDLPVLYIVRDGQMQLINYRYKRPYYMVDGLFKQAYLISGKGSHQVRVRIINQNLG